MIPIYSSRRTTVKLTPQQTILKSTIRPKNEKEYEIQIMADKLGIAPKVLNFKFDNAEKRLDIEMEYIKGITIDNYLKQPNVNKQRIKHILLNAINKLYSNGIVHGDLCGDNIIVVDTNGKLIIKILDYGDAKVTEPVPIHKRDYSSFNNRNWQ
jgi:tRNA A-37 threonylcarbamoyl transferase component Bud32